MRTHLFLWPWRSGGSYGFDDFKLDLLKAPSGPADFMGDDDLWEQFMATSPVGALIMATMRASAVTPPS